MRAISCPCGARIFLPADSRAVEVRCPSCRVIRKIPPAADTAIIEKPVGITARPAAVSVAPANTVPSPNAAKLDNLFTEFDPPAGQRFAAAGSLLALLAVSLVVFIAAVFFFMHYRPDQPHGPTIAILFETTFGNFEVELYPEKAPKTVANFLKYVDDEYYNNTVFHAVRAHFKIEASGFYPDYKERPAQPPIVNEADNGIRNERGTLAMDFADGTGPTCHFYINMKDNFDLDPNPGRKQVGHPVFGKVIAGMENVDRISKLPTAVQDEREFVPLDPVIILSIKRLQSRKDAP